MPWEDIAPPVVSFDKGENPRLRIGVIWTGPDTAVHDVGPVGVFSCLTKHLSASTRSRRSATLKLCDALEAVCQELPRRQRQQIGECRNSGETLEWPRAEVPDKPCSERVAWDGYTLRRKESPCAGHCYALQKLDLLPVI